MDPPGVYLVADLVTRATLEEASITSAPSPLVLPLPEGFVSERFWFVSCLRAGALGCWDQDWKPPDRNSLS